MLPSEVMGMSRFMLLTRTVSGSVVLRQPESVLIYVARVTTKARADECRWSRLPPEAMLMSMGRATTWDHIDLSGLHCTMKPW